jgi:hypothetical protein
MWLLLSAASAVPAHCGRLGKFVNWAAPRCYAGDVETARSAQTIWEIRSTPLKRRLKNICRWRVCSGLASVEDGATALTLSTRAASVGSSLLHPTAHPYGSLTPAGAPLIDAENLLRQPGRPHLSVLPLQGVKVGVERSGPVVSVSTKQIGMQTDMMHGAKRAAGHLPCVLRRAGPSY